MMMTKKKVLALASAGMVAATLICAVPAMAEGTVANQNFTKKAPGYNSASWQDSHLDTHSTITTFSSCTYYNAAGLETFADVYLYDEYGLLPDQHVASDSTTCGAMNFGQMTRSDGYHWNLLGLDGSTSTIHTLTAHATTSY